MLATVDKVCETYFLLGSVSDYTMGTEICRDSDCPKLSCQNPPKLYIFQ